MNFIMFIRFFTLLMMALYSYKRILNIEHVSRQVTCASVLFSLLMAAPLSFQPPFYELLFLVSVCVFATFTARRKPSMMFCAAFIASGVSIGINNLVTGILLYAIVIPLAGAHLHIELLRISIIIQSLSEEKLDPIHYIMIYYLYPFLELGACAVATKFFFRTKRLKHGFVFMESKEARWGGMIFSLLIAICYSFWSIINNGGRNATWETEIFLILVTNICALGIYSWWRNHTTLLYRQHIKEREAADLQAALEEKEKEIEQLQDSNRFLEKAVHRDNKLLPAMAFTVKQYGLQLAITREEKEKAVEIGTELDALMQERNHMLLDFQRQQNALPVTGLPRVDGILSFMAQKAKEDKILLDLAVTGDVREAAECSLPNEQLATILADLLDNALVSIRHSEEASRRIRVNMEADDICFSLSVQDSGIPFGTETLAILGEEKATTHSDEGGSGVGYMAIFEILREHAASIQITQHNPAQDGFTKTICIRFDGKGEVFK